MCDPSFVDALKNRRREWLTPAGVRLDAHAFHRGAPVGEPQFPEGTNLERVRCSRGEVVNLGRRLCTRGHYRRPMDSGARRRNRGVTDFVMSGVSDSANRHEKLARISLIKRKEEGYSDGLRWISVPGNGGETTRGKRFQVILTRQLDVVSEQAVDEDRVSATLVTLDNGVLTSVMLSGSGSGRAGVIDGFEPRHIARGLRGWRIVQHSVRNRGE